MKTPYLAKARYSMSSRRVELGATVNKNCWKHGISASTHCKWQSEFLGMKISTCPKFVNGSTRTPSSSACTQTWRSCTTRARMSLTESSDSGASQDGHSSHFSRARYSGRGAWQSSGIASSSLRYRPARPDNSGVISVMQANISFNSRHGFSLLYDSARHQGELCGKTML